MPRQPNRAKESERARQERFAELTRIGGYRKEAEDLSLKGDDAKFHILTKCQNYLIERNKTRHYLDHEFLHEEDEDFLRKYKAKQ